MTRAPLLDPHHTSKTSLPLVTLNLPSHLRRIPSPPTVSLHHLRLQQLISSPMPRDKDVPPAVRVYTVCDESRYLIVRNVPALGCGDELSRLFGSYGEVEECKPMDAEDCEPFTDVYWVKFSQVSNARFAKRKIDGSVFLGNKLQVSYAPQYESLSDTKEKLEGRRRDVLGRIKSGKPEGSKSQVPSHSQNLNFSHQQWPGSASPTLTGRQREYMNSDLADIENARFSHVSSNKDYFPSQSMNQTVRVVREKLDQIQSSSSNVEAGPASKRARLDNRRRI